MFCSRDNQLTTRFNQQNEKSIPYQPRQLDTPKLRKFETVTQSQLAKIIKAMSAKTCQLDIIPTDRLKQVLKGCLPALTHITNKSLDTNQFCKEWKEALVKPLIKNYQLA